MLHRELVKHTFGSSFLIQEAEEYTKVFGSLYIRQYKLGFFRLLVGHSVQQVPRLFVAFHVRSVLRQVDRRLFGFLRDRISDQNDYFLNYRILVE